MGNQFKNLKLKIENGSLLLSDYRTYESEICRHNYKILKLLSSACIIPLVLVFLSSFFLAYENVFFFRILYASLVTVFATFWILLKFVIKPESKILKLLIVLFFAIVYTFAIILGNIQQTTFPSVTFCVLECILSILFLLPPTIIGPLSFSFLIIFYITSFHNKAPSAVMQDFINGGTFYLVSFLLYVYQSKSRLNEFILQKTIKSERDTDGLTTIYNRRSLTRQIKKCLEQDNTKGILIMLDVDNFKHINDTYGHATGDAVLVQVASELKSSFRDTDIIGRFGGDEFVVFMPQTNDVNIAIYRTTEVLNNMAAKIKLPKSNDLVHGSFGISVCEETGNTYDDLFRKTDYALYQSKQSGKNRLSVYAAD